MRRLMAIDAIAVAAYQLLPDGGLTTVGGYGPLIGRHGSASAASKALAELIAASGAKTTVPANLTPSLLNVPRDLPPVYRNACHRGIADAGLKTPCMYGDPAGTATIALFGDSHAAHWFDALDAIAKQRRVRLAVVTKSACAAASVRIYDAGLKREYHECRQFQTAALAYIASLKPALVVMSSNGSGGRIPSVPDTTQDQAWAEGWAAAVAAVGATVIDPTSWLCTSKTCPPVVGNLLVYRDGSHMTTAYSAALAPVLAEKLP